VLSTFPNNALFDPTIEDRHDSRPVLVRRAVAFIDDNAHRDIALADIAAAVDITPRAVQYGFRTHLDCTPMEYVRRVRLHHAHCDLAAADRGEATVTAIAAKWGFAHTGHFATRYRETYGQSPHETLQSGF
jgi:transcriptional regulator GlxA family with amidase domain